MNVKEIVKKYLTENKYDGLYNENEKCACDLENLLPCWEMMGECIAGYKIPCPKIKGEESDCECIPEYQKDAWHIVKEKPTND